MVQLRNAVGAILEVKTVPFVPTVASMGPYHIALCNERTVYTWKYMSPTTRSGGAAAAIPRHGEGSGTNTVTVPDSPDRNSTGSMDVNVDTNDDEVLFGGDTDSARTASAIRSRQGIGMERIFDIMSINMANAQSPETFTVVTDAIADPISAMGISDICLLVGHTSGKIIRFSLPHLSTEGQYDVSGSPLRLELNCTSTRLAMVDELGYMCVYDLEARLADEDDEDNATNKSGAKFNEDENGDNSGMQIARFGKKLNIERRDVWDILWALDNEELLCVMEKTKMLIFRGENSEQPVPSANYLARFADLEVRIFSACQSVRVLVHLWVECVHGAARLVSW